MVFLRVQIDRFVDAHQPGFVECSFTDVFGQRHLFVDKVPVVTDEYLDETSTYPRSGVFACEIIGRRPDDVHGEIVTIDTEHPWGMETARGTRFEMPFNQIIEECLDSA